MKPEARMWRNMFVFGTLGMLAGLAMDARGAGLALIAMHCRAADSPGFLDALYLHWNGLPAMHIGMVLAALGAAPLSWLMTARSHVALCVAFLRHAVCLGWMLAGMTVGSIACEWLATQLVGADSLNGSATAMLGGMFLGMAWGMAAHWVLHRAVVKTIWRFDARQPIR